MKKNKKIGHAAEKRIKKILKKHGDIVQPSRSRPDGFPDFILDVDIHSNSMRKCFGVECKSIYGYNVRGDERFATFEYSQFHLLSDLEKEYNLHPMVIIEIRPRGYKPKDYLYYYVPWEAIQKHFKGRKPQYYSIGMWLIFKHGMRLDVFFNLLTLARIVVEGK